MGLEKYGFSAKEVKPQGSGACGVMIVGDVPGKEEDEAGIPFNPYGQSGSVLERAIRRRGMAREQFVLTNVVPFRPSNDWIEGAPWEAEAIEYGRSFLEAAIERFKPRAFVALGPIATRTLSELAGRKQGVSNLTGFVLPAPRYSIPVIPCFHPLYLRTGAMGLLGVMMNAIRLAVTVAREGRQPILPPVESPPSGYILTPTEAQARDFLGSAEGNSIAYDIETPYSTDEEVAEEAEGEHAIKSIQFSAAPGTGIFMPWRQPFTDIAKSILASPNQKLGWNSWKFDDPVLWANGAAINGKRHDLMWAWHHLQPDIPRGLQFAAAQLGWPWPWKHLDGLNPNFYGIVDVAILQWMAQ